MSSEKIDSLRFARGLLIGLLISVPIWILIGYLIWLLIT